MSNNQNESDYILVVEDDRVIAKLTSAHLEARDFKVKNAHSVAQAKTLISESRPMLIIMDIELPDGDGLAFCRELKSETRYEAVPIVMLTGLDDPLSVGGAFRAGAIDYIRKPYVQEELIARIRMHTKMSHIVAELTEKNTAVEKELMLASNVQRGFLPAENRRKGAFKTAMRFRPSTALAGDMCGQCAIGNGKEQAFFLLDVAGHGVGAALVAVATIGQLTQILTEGMFDPAGLESDLAHVLSLEKNGFYGTLALAIVDAESGETQIYNYGHPPVLVLEKPGREPFIVEATASPLGMGYTKDVEVFRCTLDAGAKILVYSDGLNDMMSAHFQTVLSAMQGALKRSDETESIADHIMTLSDAYRDKAHDDDATLLLIDYRQDEANEPTRPSTKYDFQIPSILSQMAGWWTCALPLIREDSVCDDIFYSDLRLAYTEAISNAIVHAHGEDGRPLKLTLYISENDIELHIEDSGKGFDWPKQRKLPDANAESGRGIFLIESIIDTVIYQRLATKNVLVLRRERSNRKGVL